MLPNLISFLVKNCLSSLGFQLSKIGPLYILVKNMYQFTYRSKMCPSKICLSKMFWCLKFKKQSRNNFSYGNYSTLQNLNKGDSLFAKRFIPAHLPSMPDNSSISAPLSPTTCNMTSADKDDAHKNLMSYNDTYDLNLPAELSE